MNKTALGFFTGVLIIAAGAVGYWLAKSATEQKSPSISAPSTEKVAEAAKDAAQAKDKPAAGLAERAKEAMKKAAEKKDTDAPKKPAAGGGTTITMARGTSVPKYTPGGTVDVALRLDIAGDDIPRALGISELLPDGLVFDGMVGDEKPSIFPEPGKAGKVEFVWIQVPKFPLNLAYRVKAADGTTGVKEITGQALMRASGPEIRSAMVSTKLEQAAAGETLTPVTPTLEAPAAAPAAEAAAPAPAADAAKEAAMKVEVDKEATKKKMQEAAEKLKAEQERLAKEEEMKKNTPPVEVARAVAAGGYTPGQPVEVSVTLNYSGTDPISALALVETLPEGWTFDKVTGGAAPAVAPAAGKTGIVTFIWVQVPTIPATLTYTVIPPATDTGAKVIAGKAAFRTTGPQIEGPVSATELVNK